MRKLITVSALLAVAGFAVLQTGCVRTPTAGTYTPYSGSPSGAAPVAPARVYGDSAPSRRSASTVAEAVANPSSAKHNAKPKQPPITVKPAKPADSAVSKVNAVPPATPGKDVKLPLPKSAPSAKAATAATDPVKLIAPRQGQTLEAGRSVKIRYDFVPLLEGDHVHAFVDDRLVKMLFTRNDTYELEPLSSGKHVIRLALHNSDHQPLGFETQVRVNVGSVQPAQAAAKAVDAPAKPTPAQPAAKPPAAAAKPAPIVAKNAGGSVTLSSPRQGETLAAGQPIKINYGFTPLLEGDHVHAFVDGRLVKMLFTQNDTYQLEPLPPGKHVIRLALHDSTHEPQGVATAVTVNVN